MRGRVVALVAGAVIALVAVAIATLVYVRVSGLDSRGQPMAGEAAVARALRRFAVPASVRSLKNPVPLTPEVLEEGMAHFADHCANCHANDGSGNAELNRGLYPKAPDMRLAATQQLSDGELFHVIEHGVRFTGMPGWSTGTSAGEQSTWYLVHFIRHLPRLSADELDRMADLTPRSREEVRQEIEEERFLNP